MNNGTEIQKFSSLYREESQAMINCGKGTFYIVAFAVPTLSCLWRLPCERTKACDVASEQAGKKEICARHRCWRNLLNCVQILFGKFTTSKKAFKWNEFTKKTLMLTFWTRGIALNAAQLSFRYHVLRGCWRWFIPGRTKSYNGTENDQPGEFCAVLLRVVCVCPMYAQIACKRTVCNRYELALRRGHRLWG